MSSLPGHDPGAGGPAAKTIANVVCSLTANISNPAMSSLPGHVAGAGGPAAGEQARLFGAGQLCTCTCSTCTYFYCKLFLDLTHFIYFTVSAYHLYV